MSDRRTFAARHRPAWTGLGGKLFLAFGAVILVGVSTLWVAVSLTAPRLFEQHMLGMTGGTGSMMAGTQGAMDASLTAAFREAMSQALVVATLAALLSAVVASVFVTGRIVDPVRRLASASRRLADGHYAERVPTGGDDELGDLAMTFNDMATALETTERRRRELIGDVALSCAPRSPRSKATSRGCSTAWLSPSRPSGRGSMARPAGCADSSTICRSCRALRHARSPSHSSKLTRRTSSELRSIGSRPRLRKANYR
jgi:HAMP domain-containing protein